MRLWCLDQIVPPKPSDRLVEHRAGNVENAFAFLYCRPLVFILKVVIIEGDSLEEICRRQLFWVADDDQLATPCDRADGVLRLELRCLVHDDEVKTQSLRNEVLGYRVRAPS